MSHWAHAHTGTSIFGPGDLRSRLTRRRLTEDDESAQTSSELVCVRVSARAGFRYLYKENNEEIEVGYPSELLEEILWDEIPYCVL